MGKAVHKLSNIDVENRKADCASCGRVSIRLKSKGKVWACLISQRSYSQDGIRRRRMGLGVSENDVAYIRREAAGICQICKSTGNDLSLDHDHKSGKFRGFICAFCNRGLGFFKDNPIFLSNAIKYLNDFNNSLSP